MVEVEGCREHDPVRVVDDVEMDGPGRAVRWLAQHLECVRCGEVLDLVVEAPRAAGTASGVAR